MKKLLIVLVLSIAFAVSTSAQNKIATISLKKVFDGYWKTKQSEAQLKERAGDFDKQLAELETSYKKANEDYKKVLDSVNDSGVSVEERDKRKKNAESKLMEIKEIEANVTQFQRSARTTLSEQQRRLRDKIVQEIQEIVTAKSKVAGYSVVLDSSGEGFNSNVPVVVFSSGENDLTDEVLKQLNVNAPADALKPASTPEKEAPAKSK